MRQLSSILCVAFLTACGATRQYALPMNAQQARQSFAPLAACAGQKNLENAVFDDAVHVKVDDTAWIYYGIAAGDASFDMALQIDSDKVPPAEQENKFKSVKAIGDEIWACAEAKVKGSPTVNVTVNTAGDPSAAATNTNLSLCDRMFKCYADLATAVCEGNADAGCKSQFEVKISGTPDDAACKDALANVHFIIEPFKNVRVDLKMPAVCQL